MLKKLNNLQIRERLSRAFITVACILTLVSAVILVTMIVMSRIYAATIVNYGFSQGDIGRAMAQFADTRSAMRGIIGYDDQDAIDTLLNQRITYKEDFTKEFNSLESAMVTAENKKLYNDLKAKLADYWVLEEEIVNQGATVDREQCKLAQDKALGELAPMYNEIYDELTQIMEIKVDKGQEVSSLLTMIVVGLTVIIIVIITASIIFAISLGKGIANSIAVPLDLIRDRLDIFAKGDLSSPFPVVDTKDELAEMVTVTTNMAATLQFIINDTGNVLTDMASANFSVVSADRSKYVGEFESILTAMRQLKGRWQKPCSLSARHLRRSMQAQAIWLTRHKTLRRALPTRQALSRKCRRPSRQSPMTSGLRQIRRVILTIRHAHMPTRQSAATER